MSEENKAKPEHLGDGAARRAAEKVERRGRDIDAAVDAAVNGDPPVKERTATREPRRPPSGREND